MAELYGKKDGLCGGKGGSMHIADLTKGMMGANGIVGGGSPLACGAALAAKTKGDKGVSVVFVGDGGSNQGTTLESMNLASVWKLPLLFVVENNGYAEATSSSYSVAGADVFERAKGFDMPGVKVNGHDFCAVYDAAEEAVERARAGEGPTLIECKVNRYFGHFEGDAQTYRAPDEVKNIREKRDCIVNFGRSLTESSLITQEELDKIDEEVKALIDDAVTKAKEAAEPTEEDLETDVYVEY